MSTLRPNSSKISASNSRSTTRTCSRQLANLEGILVEPCNKRMSKGMKIVSPPIRTLKFDASKSEFLRIDVILGMDEDRDSLVSA
jgi:hypothetical protein